MPPSQAAGLAEAWSETLTIELATKSDLRELRGWASAEFADIRGEMRAEFADVRREMRTAFAEARTEFARIRGEISESKAETIRWMVGLFVAQLTVTIGVLLRLAG
ncbi:MAG: DUF1640 domain-containing protein [Alphaproteobacteria bacterium]|nr:DUF1640 domain-containing protein [Alphaproteobacteria bacterium]